MNNQSPFDFLDVDGPYTFYKLVGDELKPFEANGVHQVLRDATYVREVAKRFIEKYPERKSSVIKWDELKTFDEQEKHSVEGQDRQQHGPRYV